MHRRQMKMETFLRLPPPLSPVIPGIVVDDDDDVTNDERRVDDVFIATLDSLERVSLRKFLSFLMRKKTHKTGKKSAYTRIRTNDDDDDDVLPSPTQPPRVRGVYHRY